ncbi:sensor histidine kinase [Euzebyella saccharophila]|uniref:histidine kinase n=1 Tax=Euzebyella saccharophila TaxID=679664 RepID=A0ABV8JJN8_9FLAO|nr:sensor histidine kinase [Euzebyella saccharophila]
MPKSLKIDHRQVNQTRLLKKFIYNSSFLSLLFALFCIVALQMRGLIPIIFGTFAICNLLNLWHFKTFGNLTKGAVMAAVFSFVGAATITLLSGGINSPFIFVMVIIVLGGYVSARKFGNIYLISTTLAIVLIYTLSEIGIYKKVNEVPENSKDLFALISILFSVYMLGGVFGKDLLKSYHRMVESKNKIEKRILEKEHLLRTVHHRVKNNLQTVSSLLNLQAKNSGNEQIKNLVLSSQNRVNAMAMIHEMLYLRDNLSKIEFKPYVRELSEYLIQSTHYGNHDVKIKLDIPEVKLSIDTAIPLGLLINEAVTNSLKYGFVQNKNGQIDIQLRKDTAMNSYHLNICDNGIGYSKDVDLRTSKSLGLKLIHTLARQLKGSVKRDSSIKGTCYHIIFKEITNPS